MAARVRFTLTGEYDIDLQSEGYKTAEGSIKNAIEIDLSYLEGEPEQILDFLQDMKVTLELVPSDG